MLLYHFTARQNLPLILKSGLVHGSVPVAPGRSMNAVWLTTDPGPNGHGLEVGGCFMTADDRRQVYEWTGRQASEGERLPKAAEVRIEVDLDHDDRRLHDWFPWARRHLAPDWLARLHPVGGDSLRKAKSWRLFFGLIPREAFRDIALLEASPGPPARTRPAATA